jgi:hypothetical protein
VRRGVNIPLVVEYTSSTADAAGVFVTSLIPVFWEKVSTLISNIKMIANFFMMSFYYWRPINNHAMIQSIQRKTAMTSISSANDILSKLNPFFSSINFSKKQNKP